MDKRESNIGNSNESISSIETFDIILNNMNRNFMSNQETNKNDIEEISPNNDTKTTKPSSNEPKKNIFKLILYKVFDTLSFIILILGIVFLFFSLIVLVAEFAVSYYSVIIINYVFFVSSMVSYTMAPLYQSLSNNWINCGFSLTQVILTSPLIAFYIFYILKSVSTLGSFVMEITDVVGKIFSIFKVFYRDLITSYLSNFCELNHDRIFINEIFIFVQFFASLLLLAIVGGILYGLFCFDKTIIILGSFCYILNTIQIIVMVLPSYWYFFKTLINWKCKEIECINSFIKGSNDILDFFLAESEKEKSDSSESMVSLNDTSSDSNMNAFDLTHNKNDKHPEKLIKDPYISDFHYEHKEADDKSYKVIGMLLQLIIAKSYFSLYYYSKTIAFDKHQKKRKIVFMHLFFYLNLAVISYDIYNLTKNYSVEFLISVIIRFLFIPLFSYYNILSIFFNRSKDKSLNVVLYVSSIFTGIIILIIVACFSFKNFYQEKYRIANLEYVPFLNDYTIANNKMTNHTICDYHIFNVSAFDAFGYSLGGYDVKRNKTIFDNQMKFFFNEDYSNHISYKVHEIDEHFLFIKYYDSSINTHIFAFRGYNSGPEIAFQLELIAAHYIIPFFADIVPLYEIINDFWLGFYTDFLNSFGLKFFENDNLMVKYIDSIIKIYNNENLTENDRVLFAGVNCGGAIAKILGILLHHKSISFISLPIDNELFDNMFGFSPSFISLVTNVYNVDGFFSGLEPRYATNIAIDMPIFDQTKFCTSGVCEINSKTDNVYRTFCAISEICGKGNRFGYYCENVIGKTDLDTIRDSLMEDD